MEQKDNITKMLILYGSPHKDGYTSRLLSVFNTMLKQYIEDNQTGVKLETSLYNAYELNVAPCMDCMECKSRRPCMSDSFKDIEKAITEADIITVATPVYFMSFPAPLKAIIDRTQSIWVSEYILKNSLVSGKNRKGVLLLTCGRDILNGSDIVVRQANALFYTLNAYNAGTAIFTGTDHVTNHKVPDKAIRDIKKCIVNLFDN